MNERLAKNYEPSEVGRRVYQRWLAADAFAAWPDERSRRYVIMMPLPNVTGALHMGHAMDNVMQDLLTRWHRMMGDNTLWMPGTDHAGIATQAIVEKFLLEREGRTRLDIGREELVARIWEWKERSEKRIVEQQQLMGCSCDWARQRFTMDPVCAAAVRETFFRLFRDGLIYRGDRLVNWDCYLKTAVSDDEIYYKTVAGAFWHLKYPVIDPQPGEPLEVVVATTRPETMLGDTAVACHPDPAAALAEVIGETRQRLSAATDKERAELEDELAALERRQREHLPRLVQLAAMARAGRHVRLPLVEREIPLILDEWARPELGSGCVKITPAHDPNDYEVWQRHASHIGILNILEPDGTLGENAGPYRGLDRFVARRRVVEDLERLGLLGPVEPREIEVGHSDRSKTIVEPYLSRQWWVLMGDRDGGVVLGRGTPREQVAAGLAQAALDAVDPSWSSPSGRRLTFDPDPASYGAIYRNWLVEKRDWCISRQLWWGHRIPIWHGAVAPERLAQTLAQLPQGAEEDLWVWLGGPGGQQISPREALRRDPGELAGYELQACLRHPEAEARHAATLEALGLTQDEDVLDTWFSSALWPHSTLGWPDPAILGAAARGADGQDVLSYYYPGSCLVTGRDIITLWVARMVIMGLYNLGDVPFTDCFVHATILDGKGETMSKSKGNGIDPGAIIERYGVDAMRYLICHMQTGAHYVRLPVQAICPDYDPATHASDKIDLATASHGRTRQGDENLFTYLCPDCGREFDVTGTTEGMPSAPVISDRFEMGRNFCTKLWSAARFTLMNVGEHTFRPLAAPELSPEDRWILSRTAAAIDEVTAALAAYNPSAALQAARNFFWGELCDWYLEMVKFRVRDQAEAPVAAQVLATVLDQVLRLLHPFLPFITEELWQRLGEQVPVRGISAPLPAAELLVGSSWPRAEAWWRDEVIEQDLDILREVLRAIRDLRAKHDVPPGRRIEAAVRAPAATVERLELHRDHLLRLGQLSTLAVGVELAAPALAASQVMGEMEVYVSGLLDRDKESARLARQRDEIVQRLAQTRGKLDNPRFVERAPTAVVEAERLKLGQLEEELRAVEARLGELAG